MPGTFGHNVEHDSTWRLAELLRTSDATAIAFQKKKKTFALSSFSRGAFFAMGSRVVNLCLVLPQHDRLTYCCCSYKKGPNYPKKVVLFSAL